jgi:hypothetical protein
VAVELRSWHRIAEPPSGPFFEALLDFAVARRGHYPTFSLVQRGQKPATGAAAELLAALEPFLITTTGTGKLPPPSSAALPAPPAGDAAEKPAPKKAAPSSGSFAAAAERLHFYRLERGAAVVLARAGGLAAFAAPLPEDLCLLASDKTPWLYSDVRAGRYRLQLTAEEHKAIAKSLPWLQLAAE